VTGLTPARMTRSLDWQAGLNRRLYQIRTGDDAFKLKRSQVEVASALQVGYQGGIKRLGRKRSYSGFIGLFSHRPSLP
jgi:hypothetical protein